MPDTAEPDDSVRHTLLEDAHAFILGTVLVSIGLEFFRLGGLITGGTAGIAFLIHYLTGYELGRVYFVINLPFYALAWWAMGWQFTLKTFIAVAMLSVFTTTLPMLLVVSTINPLYSAVAGGLLMGMGILALIRHQGSLGGVNIFALALQKNAGLRAGKVQMLIDCLIVATAFITLDVRHVGLSIIGAISMNLVLALNHKPGRYNGF